MNRRRITFSFLLALMLMAMGCLSVSAAGTKTAAKKTGWIQKSSGTYYRDKSGKLVKNQGKKIGKYTYLFDAKGRVVKGTKRAGTYTDCYSEKNGRYRYSRTDLKITSVENGSLIARKGTMQYEISSGVKVVNRSGKTISFSALKKGQRIRVYFDNTVDGGILESYPAQFAKILKVKVL